MGGPVKTVAIARIEQLGKCLFTKGAILHPLEPVIHPVFTHYW